MKIIKLNFNQKTGEVLGIEKIPEKVQANIAGRYLSAKRLKKIISISIIIMFSPFIIGILFGYPLGIILNCKSDGIQTISCFRNGNDYIEFIRVFNILPFLSIFTIPLGVIILVVGFFVKAILKKNENKSIN